MRCRSMKRTIYTFYCYTCHHWQKSTSPIPHIQNNNKLISIFCFTCQKQVPLNKTNLSSERYKIDFERQWHIIDQDSKIPHTVFLSDSKAIIKDICNQLNSGTPISVFQDDLLSIADILRYIMHKSHD